MQLLTNLFPNVANRLPELGQALIDTFLMLLSSGLFTVLLGGFLGLVLVLSKEGALFENRLVYELCDKIVSIFRSIPFIILLALVMPLSRLITGTTIGVWGALVPLVLGAAPFYARQVESALSELDPGLIEAASAMGLSKLEIVFSVYLKESVAGLSRGLTITLISLLNLTAMAGVVGAGGIGDYAIRYGHDRNQYDITILSVIILVLLVGLIQFLGNSIAQAAEDRSNPSERVQQSESKYNPAQRRVFFAAGLTAAACVALLIFSLAVTGSFKQFTQSKEERLASAPSHELKIGLTGVLNEDTWSFAKEKLAQEGIKLDFVQFGDYTQPNKALDNGEIDLNAFQHIVFLNNEKKTHNYQIQEIGYTTIQTLNLFSFKYKSLDELKSGDVVAIPNDVTNGGRALKVLESAGLISIDPKVGYLPTLNDVTAYHKDIKIQELAANTIPTVLKDIAAGVVNGNFALDFDLQDEQIIYHDNDLDHPEYWNLIAARIQDIADPEKKEIFRKVVAAYQSAETNTFLEERMHGFSKQIGWDQDLLK